MLERVAISLTRVSRNNEMATAYAVFLDGQELTQIPANNTATFEVFAGVHTLVVKEQGEETKPLSFKARAGRPLKFICGRGPSELRETVGCFLSLVAGILSIFDGGITPMNTGGDDKRLWLRRK